MDHFTGVFSRMPIGSCDVDISQREENEPPTIANHNSLRIVDEFAFIEHQSDKVFQVNGVIVALIGHPNWEGEEGKSSLACEQSVKCFVECWQSQGVGSLQRVTGHFALALIDNNTQSCHLYSDRIGVYRLYWHEIEDARGLGFGSTIAGIKRVCKLANEISPDALYAYMYFHMVPTPYSIHPKIHKLKPGCVLSYASGRLDEIQLCDVRFEENTKASFSDLKNELSILLDQSVVNKRYDQSEVASFLSGGIDSSTVTGCMAKMSDSPVTSYSIGFDAEEYDETPFARITAGHFKSQHTEYYVTPQDVIDILPSIAASSEEPFGNSSVVPTYYCAKRAAQDGVKLMMAGDGGDELFAGNERYAKQRYFNYYLQLPEPLRRKVFDPLIQYLPNVVPLASKAKSYVDQANTPLPDRLQSYNFLNRFALEDIFNADYLASVDTSDPLQLQQAVYNAPSEATSLNRMLYLDWHFTLADNDLRKVSNMCALAGVEVAYPLLTDELIDFSMKVPSKLKLKGAELRYFFKESLKDFLHPQTLSKSKHGFGLPFGVWLRDYAPLRELAHDSLQQLKTRGYFKPSFVDHAINMHEQGHASYYGELVWLLMMLELWLQAHHYDAA